MTGREPGWDDGAETRMTGPAGACHHLQVGDAADGPGIFPCPHAL